MTKMRVERLISSGILELADHDNCFSGRPLALPTVFAKANAVVFAWQPGIEAGNSLADLLFGDVTSAND